MSNEFLDLLETYKAEDATVQRVFNKGDGRGVRSMRRSDPRYQQSLTEAVGFYGDVLKGRVRMDKLQEAMSTSDFPLLFGDIIDRQLLGIYQEWPSVWQQIAKVGNVRDFRKARRFTIDGAEGVLDPVPQGAPYPGAAVHDGVYEYAVSKYGRRLSFLWEAFINDDLDALRDMPNRLAKSARMSEERFATELYVDSTGPDATYFTAGSNNLITTGGVGLDADKLGQAYTALRSQKDEDDNPIFTGNVRLVVPTALEITARNLLNATQIAVAPGATAGQQVITQNWMSQTASLVVNPWLDVVDDSAHAKTTWYLFAEPSIGRPAMEVGFLTGHETPQLFMKAPDQIAIGGGVVGAQEGSFDTDGVDYKVRHVFGGTMMDTKAAVAYVGA